jgi:tetratricopeptide (TPR) repeat protein
MDILARDAGFYWLLVLGTSVAALFVRWARLFLQRTVGQYGSIPSSCGLTGASAARQLLAAIGLSHVPVVRSNSKDCYHPRKREIQLRDATFDSVSLGALAVAAHEVGHAQQFATGYFPARLRLLMRPVGYLFTGGLALLLALGFAEFSLAWAFPLILGAGFLVLLLQVPAVLPLEYDASRRAKKLVRDVGLLAPFEETGFERVLTAASRTYLAWEGQRWIMLLIAAGTIPLLSSTLTPFSRGDELPQEQFAVVDAALRDQEVLDITLPFFSTGVMLVPAVIFLILISRLATHSRGHRTSHERAIERNNAAMGLSQRGEVAAAVEAFTSALAIDPKLHAAYYNRGNCYLRLGLLPEALVDIEASLVLNPNFVDAVALRGQILTQRGEYDLALADFDKALQMSPKSSLALSCRGNLHLAQRNYERASIDFGRALEINPNEPLAFQGRAIVSLASGKLDAALADCSEAIASGVNGAYAVRARIWVAKGEHERAISDLTAALTQNPTSADAFRDRGLIWYLKGEADRAVADLDEAIKLNAGDSVAYNNRGAAHLKAGRYAEAVADLEAAIRLAPEFANPYKHLAWLQATCPDAAFRNGQSAVTNATRALALSKENSAEWLAVLAAAHAEAGDFEKAVRCQGNCLEASPDTAKAEAQERLELFQAGRPLRDPMNWIQEEKDWDED